MGRGFPSALFSFFRTRCVANAGGRRGRSPAIVLFECCHLGRCGLLINGVGGLLDRALVRLSGFACDVLVSRDSAFSCHAKDVSLQARCELALALGAAVETDRPVRSSSLVSLESFVVRSRASVA